MAGLVAARNPRRTPVAWSLGAPALLGVLTVFALYLRLRSLDTTPPWLWWQEAAGGLAARALLHGESRGMLAFGAGRSPLYTYLSVPFVAAWDGRPFAVRLAAALLGAAEAPALYFLARGLWRGRPLAGTWAGVVAAGAWTAGYWSQSINRIGLAVNALPLLLTAAAIAWLNWTRRPAARRAVTFGLLAGLALLAYPPGGGVSLLLWSALALLLPAATRRALRPSLSWALLAAAAAASPLAVACLVSPAAAFAALHAFVARASYTVAAWPEQARGVLGAFLGYAGDPDAFHSIPRRLPFSLIMTGLFIGGVFLAVAGRPRHLPRSALLLFWWLALCLPAVVAADHNPNLALLLAALPPALLLAAWPVALAAQWLSRHAPSLLPRLALLVALVLAVEGLTTASDYFETWPRQPGLYTAYQGDVWSLADRALKTPGAVAVLPLADQDAAGLDYAFGNAPLWHLQVVPASVEAWLVAHLGAAGGVLVKTALWDGAPYVDADAAQALPFYLAREGTAAGTEAQQGYQILSYRLGPQPAFAAAGQSATPAAQFAGGLTLASARWGAAYPNAERDGVSAAGGTPFWAIITWRADSQLKGKRVALDLVDPAGRRLASSDTPLLDAVQERASGWQTGTAVHTYNLVRVPATQAPGPVALEVRVYDAASEEPLLPTAGTPRQSVQLAQGRTTFATADAPLPATVRPLAQDVLPEIQLLGIDPWPASVAPGQVVGVQVYWRAFRPLPPRLALAAELGETGVTVDQILVADTPTGLTQAVRFDLRVPAAAGTGAYTVWLTAQAAAGSRVALGTVQVAGRPRVFTVPPIPLPSGAGFAHAVRLLGLSGPPDVAVVAGESVTVTLTWQATATPGVDWVRFLHVLGADGRPAAQADGQPCAGGCPASSWLPGEVLEDDVTVAIPTGLPPGSYPLAVGWYDPTAAGLPRLPAVDAAGARLANDLAVLPVRLVVRH